MGLCRGPGSAAVLPRGLLCLLLLAAPTLSAGRPPPVVLGEARFQASAARRFGQPAGGQAGQAERRALPLLQEDRQLFHALAQPGAAAACHHRLLDRQHQVTALRLRPPSRLVYNRTSRTTHFPEGVDVQVPGFGETFSLEFLDPSKRSVGSYFHTMVESLVGWGYTRGEDVRGAPYDWRRAPTAAAGLEGQVHPGLRGPGCTLGGRSQDTARPGLRRQQPDPSHRVPEDPGAAALGRVHQLAAAVRHHLVPREGVRAHTHRQLHAAGLRPLLPGYRFPRRLAHAAGHGGAGPGPGAPRGATPLSLRHGGSHPRLLLLRDLPRSGAEDLLRGWRRHREPGERPAVPGVAGPPAAASVAAGAAGQRAHRHAGQRQHPGLSQTPAPRALTASPGCSRPPEPARLAPGDTPGHALGLGVG
ncbi:phospholipase A2 group XV isoform X2 [Sorex araneus]|uniref:phospholipase A2 group XV isoform X2 n=1 Tax=Sorex araneus TaxID=42254 RepID=UPI002433D069|nr:phospholipase A2 group XV isoform X2 [Sorex araneus]